MKKHIQQFITCLLEIQGRFLFFSWQTKRSNLFRINSKLSCTYSRTYLFLRCLWEQEDHSNFQNKSVNSPVNLVSRYILFLPKLKGKERSSLEGCKKGDHIARLLLGRYKTWKILSFVKIEIILPFLCFLLDPLTNKHCRTRSSMTNLWIDFWTCQK